MQEELEDEMPDPPVSRALVAFVFATGLLMGGAAGAWVFADRLVGAFAAGVLLKK